MKSLDRRKKNSTADFAKQTDTQMGEQRGKKRTKGNEWNGWNW